MLVSWVACASTPPCSKLQHLVAAPSETAPNGHFFRLIYVVGERLQTATSDAGGNHEDDEHDSELQRNSLSMRTMREIFVSSRACKTKQQEIFILNVNLSHLHGLVSQVSLAGMQNRRLSNGTSRPRGSGYKFNNFPFSSLKSESLIHQEPKVVGSGCFAKFTA